MLICHLYIYTGEVFLQVFGPFLNQVICSLISFKDSLYILSDNLLPDLSLASVFSSFSLSSLSFEQQF